ncbi:hypothetical protein BDZ97DRAFT_1923451 [Flammula alnicola]|nr:hypothetical protein BDZ97DRAFT_1923451 [Flammula alnicola]
MSQIRNALLDHHSLGPSLLCDSVLFWPIRSFSETAGLWISNVERCRSSTPPSPQPTLSRSAILLRDPVRGDDEQQFVVFSTFGSVLGTSTTALHHPRAPSAAPFGVACPSAVSTTAAPSSRPAASTPAASSTQELHAPAPSPSPTAHSPRR